MRRHARARGYELVHRSRPVHKHDFGRFDLLVAMDAENERALHELSPDAHSAGKIVRMTDYLRHHLAEKIPDSYYGGPEGFEEVLNLLEDACGGLLAELCAD